MKRLKFIFILVLSFVSILLIVVKQNKKLVVQQQSVITEVIDYMPTTSPNDVKEGSCWTGSNNASSNPNAYRCTIGHNLYDPCFKEQNNKVICGITPVDNSKSFELKLTEPLPNNNLRADKDSGLAPWIAELDNKVICTKFGGTAGDIPRADGKIGDLYFYTCGDKSVIVGHIDTSGPLWRAQTAFIKADGSDYQTHNILKVWR